jgi:glutamate formiminotransferase
MDADHHRSVITFAGTPAAVSSAAVRCVAKAAELIDLNLHSGVHPRIGAADVVPFVPIEGISSSGCASLARDVARKIWENLKIPVYLYEDAARTPERRRLETIRKGNLTPDFGGPELHPTAGAVVVGARKFLVAWNVHLNTSDVSIAKNIARTIRESSGGLPHVKALGLWLASRGIAQVSMNLTDFEVTPPHVVLDRIREECRRYGVEITGTEIIGLLPGRVLEMAAEASLQFENFTRSLVLEHRLNELLSTDE